MTLRPFRRVSVAVRLRRDKFLAPFGAVVGERFAVVEILKIRGADHMVGIAGGRRSGDHGFTAIVKGADKVVCFDLFTFLRCCARQPVSVISREYLDHLDMKFRIPKTGGPVLSFDNISARRICKTQVLFDDIGAFPDHKPNALWERLPATRFHRVVYLVEEE